eukprot:scaffold47429_cov52-Phaeocystis_antarctica.AAC.2
MPFPPSWKTARHAAQPSPTSRPCRRAGVGQSWSWGWGAGCVSSRVREVGAGLGSVRAEARVEARAGAGVETVGGTHATCFCEVILAGGTTNNAVDESTRELRPAKGFSKGRTEDVAWGMVSRSFRVRPS